jgi:hypothetical protein
MTGLIAATAVDLRRAPLAAIRDLDLRAIERDMWADERAMWDRLHVAWAGLDDAAWHLPGAAPSDAGGPDWSLAEHVGHLADWQELASDYTGVAIDTGRWPTDDDYDGGDFDRFNEGRRAPWTTMPRVDITGRLGEARRVLLARLEPLSAEVIRSDAAWGWVYLVLHGHYLDHLGVIEPWADALRPRQVDGDPFVDDPRATSRAGFLEQDDLVGIQFDELVREVPPDRWDGEELTPGWTLRDHVGHLADWAAEGVRAIDVFNREGRWLADPPEGIDAWNEARVAASRGESAAATLRRYDDARSTLRDAVGTLSVDDLRSPDGWSWAYDCLHGHVRKHLAMLGPWCAAVSWPRDQVVGAAAGG